ncbi:MAG TPA: hypothetical protein DCM54_04135 [Gammaproteobacteria bacterium]|nr:hypothetical protein [Gammaproteobacteria bacterium]|tara:strand:+ start:1421 stop:1825 length:405 start_codon:yes stop_codon:yes gene_type:complete
MKIFKRIAIGIVIVYVLIIVAFESMLGYSQPEFEGTVVLTTTNENEDSFERVLTRLVTNDTLYVRVNHWPRAWYYRLIDNPNVKVTVDGETNDYLAVEIEGDEYELVQNDHDAGIVFRILTGFPPRHIVRFDPL